MCIDRAFSVWILIGRNILFFMRRRVVRWSFRNRTRPFFQSGRRKEGRPSSLEETRLTKHTQVSANSPGTADPRISPISRHPAPAICVHLYPSVAKKNKKRVPISLLSQERLSAVSAQLKLSQRRRPRHVFRS